jgi:hypothetical protein
MSTHGVSARRKLANNCTMRKLLCTMGCLGGGHRQAFYHNALQEYDAQSQISKQSTFQNRCSLVVFY